MYLERFSNYGKLLRVIAFVLRFIENCRHQTSERKFDSLTSEELNKAEKNLIKGCQADAFSEEIMKINSSGAKPSIVKQLCLFLDEDGCIRCRGRICYTEMANETKNPYLLPKKDTVTCLISGTLTSAMVILAQMRQCRTFDRNFGYQQSDKL